ncbi:MAG: hypothetical protein CSA97_05940 [Bacteroidetes bacterium]|nr:MAG: hypothetical protein CSA97_05940 [Bacteroidota bacterium]
MKFQRIPLFLLGVLIAIYALVYLNEEILGTSYLPGVESLPGFRPNPVSVEPDSAVSSIISQANAVENLNALFVGDKADTTIATAPVPFVGVDSTQQTDTVLTAPPLPTVDVVQALEFDERGKAQLSRFFAALKNSQKQQVRIFHFGDSQIEGDRISSFLRSRLQNTFGGGGVGLVPLVPNHYLPYGLRMKAKGWKRFNFMPARKRIKGLDYGLCGSLARCVDTFEENDTVYYFADVVVRRSRNAGRAMNFNRCRILYHPTVSPTTMDIDLADTIYDSYTSEGSAIYQEHSFTVPHKDKAFTLSFSSEGPIEVYGLSLETQYGVQVDNVALRGSSGTDFTSFSDSLLTAYAQHFAPRLILLQFGVNVVPSRLKDYSYYQRQLKRQILRLKRLFPTAAFILIGVSDMAQKVGETMQSYSNIPIVKEAQRKAAFEAGIAFWDMQAAMGGTNAMLAWVAAKKSLATKDYVHFTPRGARLIAEMFYAALLDEYTKYSRGGARAE